MGGCETIVDSFLSYDGLLPAIFIWIRWACDLITLITQELLRNGIRHIRTQSLSLMSIVFLIRAV